MFVEGFVLAGGASRRMGRDKARLPIDGVPLAVVIADVLYRAGCRPVRILTKAARLKSARFDVLHESDARHHPLIGVATGLTVAKGPLVLFSPCDLPALTPDAVQQLLAFGRPCHAAGQPLLCVLPKAWSVRAATIAAEGGPARSMVNGLPTVKLPEAALLNANTPQEMERALATIKLRREVTMFQVLMVADEMTQPLRACEAVLCNALPGTSSAQVSNHPEAIFAAIDAATSACVILCGGDTLFTSPAMKEVIKGRQTLQIPGFAESLRRKMTARLGPVGALMDAAAAGMGAQAVFALPASEVACTAAAPMVATMWTVLRQHLQGEPVVALPSTEHAEPIDSDVEIEDIEDIDAEVEVIEEPLEGGVHVTAFGAEPPPEENEETSARWKMALTEMNAELDRERWVDLPHGVETVAPLRELLERAGERGTATLSDGRKVAVFGFPDLRRPNSKVLMVAETRGVLEVVALHRYPQKTAIVGRNTLAKLGEVDAEAIARTRQPTPYGGLLYATDTNAVFVKRDQRVYRWDGRREVEEGTENQAAASLLLRWSER